MAYSHSLSGLEYITSPDASLNNYFSFLSHFVGQWTVNKCHIWILEETIKYHYPKLVANAKRNEEVIRVRAVSLFSWSVEQMAPDTPMTTRVTEGARQERHALVSRVSRLRRSTLARASTSLTKSEQKERLLAV